MFIHEVPLFLLTQLDLKSVTGPDTVFHLLLLP